METKTHWEEIYTAKPVTEASWFQEHSDLSLQLIEERGVGPTGRIIDVGGGASMLADDLLAHHFENVTVLDISAAALKAAQQRLGPRAAQIIWLEADITTVSLPHHHYDVWHDRAVFHFLTRAEDRHRYVQAVRQAVKPGGHLIIATFAPDGPSQCSGLEVMRKLIAGSVGWGSADDAQKVLRGQLDKQKQALEMQIANYVKGMGG